MKFFYVILITVFIVNKTVDSCYITNCPWGGKRSLSNDLTSRQCIKCASGLGTCFGSRICCGQDIGCLLDTKETLVCREEDIESSSPCTPYGKSCSKLEFGRCATNSLCCSPERCVFDSDCSNESLEELSDLKSNKEKILEKKILNAIKYLLKERKESNNSDK